VFLSIRKKWHLTTMLVFSRTISNSRRKTLEYVCVCMCVCVSVCGTNSVRLALVRTDFEECGPPCLGASLAQVERASPPPHIESLLAYQACQVRPLTVNGTEGTSITTVLQLQLVHHFRLEQIPHLLLVLAR